MSLGAQTILWGTDASITQPSGQGCLASSFGINITQGIAAAVGFGGTYVTKHGTVIEGSISVGGFVTAGTSSDRPGLATMTRAGASITCTFFTGCTLAATSINDGIGLNTAQTGTSNAAFSYQTSGTITETWVTS